MGDSINAEFSYQPLRVTCEIRLLRVFPGKGTDDICCTIYSVNLDSSPNYEALSYTWGDATKLKRKIRCDGKTLAVTRNLDSALRALRFASDTRVLWVDAVCIDQKNLVEKDAQVAMMRDIYRKAQGVVAWVGEEDHKDIAALDVGKYLDIPSKAGFSSPEELLTWLTLPTFIKRPWFSRVWIVQELAVAERLTIYCGQRQLEWDILRRGLIKFLDRMGLYLNTARADVSLERVYTLLSIRNLVTDHLRDQQEPEGHFYKFQLSRIDDDRNCMEVKAGDLLHFVKGTRLFGSTDPRDHIFALLGLVLKEDREKIVINYSLPFSDVYREFARVLIVQHGTLDVLSQAGLHSTLPSWVPDWTIPPQCYPLNMGAYSASGNTPHNGGYMRLKSMRPEEFQEMLTLRGKVLDRIESLTPGFIVSVTVESETFERTALMASKALLPVAQLFASEGNPFRSYQQIPPIGRTRTVRITPELENQWFRAAQLCERASSSEQELESVYMQTLIGNLPFKQLGSSHEALARDCFLIWRERLSQNPIMSKHGLFSSASWTGAEVRPELKELFSLHQRSSLSEERDKAANKGMVQANSSTEFPVFVNKHLYKAFRFMRSFFRSTDNTSGTAIRKDDMSIVVHDDATVKLGVAMMFSRAVERMARNRQFCRTGSGRVGWVPLEAVNGDVICVLEGGRFPYVLRPKVGGNGPYRFVGEAYIHGLMNGEGWMGEMGEISLI